jgi:hypothetical protein
MPLHCYCVQIYILNGFLNYGIKQSTFFFMLYQCHFPNFTLS